MAPSGRAFSGATGYGVEAGRPNPTRPRMLGSQSVPWRAQWPKRRCNPESSWQLPIGADVGTSGCPRVSRENARGCVPRASLPTGTGLASSSRNRPANPLGEVRVREAVGQGWNRASPAQTGGHGTRPSSARCALPRYVTECEGRHNRRPMDTSEQMGTMARDAYGKRLRYTDLIGPRETRQPPMF